MNYRHAFHAGGIADVFKHACLLAVLARLQLKPTPLHVLDTHAGIGRYDLEASEARRTGEAASGISRLIAGPIPEALTPLACAVEVENEEGTTRFYPGSPRLLASRLRPGDRATFVEKHPEDASVLAALFSADKRVRVITGDGYEALKGRVPPPEKRGLILIDPPFEDPDELPRLVETLRAAHRRWRSGVYLVWFPIKLWTDVERFFDALKATLIPDIQAATFLHAPDAAEGRLRGSGLVVVNPPWKLQEDWAAILDALPRALGLARAEGQLHLIAPE